MTSIRGGARGFVLCIVLVQVIQIREPWRNRQPRLAMALTVSSNLLLEPTATPWPESRNCQQQRLHTSLGFIGGGTAALRHMKAWRWHMRCSQP